MRIGEVAQRLGVRTSTIRFYEKRGLLPEPARIGGKRIYGADVLRRLSLIETCQKAGFSLGEIETLLRHFDAEETDLAQALLRKKIADLDAIVERAKSVREVLLESFVRGYARPDNSAFEASTERLARARLEPLERADEPLPTG